MDKQPLSQNVKQGLAGGGFIWKLCSFGKVFTTHEDVSGRRFSPQRDDRIQMTLLTVSKAARCSSLVR